MCVLQTYKVSGSFHVYICSIPLSSHFDTHKEKEGELCDQFLQVDLPVPPPQNSRGRYMGQLDSKTLRRESLN